MVYKQNLWTEDDILEILDEDDKFERKAGKLFDKGNPWREKMAVEICAFANSYGGIIVVGAHDEKDKVKTGTHFDGIDPSSRKPRFDHWLESNISRLVTPPLQNFRVLPVQPRANDSLIPEGKALYIIEIDESEIAPHQTNDDRRGYYYREGTSSKPAPHLYLEGLRSSKSFVSQTLVRAWIDTFLFSLTNLIGGSEDNFYRRRFIFNVSDENYLYKIELPETESRYSALLDHPNAKQFFSYYPRIQNQVDEYLRLTGDLQSSIGGLAYTIQESQELRKILYETITEEELKFAIFSEKSNFPNQSISEGRFESLCQIFRVPDHKDTYLMKKISAFLTFELFCRDPREYWKNQPPIDKNPTLKFFWEKHLEKFTETTNDPAVSKKLAECENKREAVIEAAGRLRYALKEVTELLTKRSGTPYLNS